MIIRKEIGKRMFGWAITWFNVLYLGTAIRYEQVKYRFAAALQIRVYSDIAFTA